MVRFRWAAVVMVGIGAVWLAGCSSSSIGSGSNGRGFLGRLTGRERCLQCEMHEIPVDGCPPFGMGPALPEVSPGGVPVYPTTPGMGVPMTIPPGTVPPSGPPGVLPTPTPVPYAVPMPASPAKGVKTVGLSTP